jgi:Ca2+-binding RTX toxin-like protein
MSASDAVTIEVIDPATIPFAADDDVTRTVGQAVDVNVLANDITGAGAALSVTAQPAHGTAAVNDHGTPDDPADDTILYTPAEGAYADDSFSYRVATARGGSGAPGTTATVRVIVGQGVALVPDPSDPSKTALLVVGSDESEVFKFSRKRDQVRVLRNKVQVGDPLAIPTGSVIVLARGGDDTVNPGTLKASAILIEGGDGNDRLTGSKFNDTLIGGDGNDVLNGAAGHDLLIGGRGADALTGAGGDDLLVTGGTPYDDAQAPENAAALRDLLSAWVAATPYADRIAAVTAIAGVGTSGASLRVELLVTDAEADLANGSGGNDFFLADTTTDKVKKTPTETNGLAPQV